MCTFFRIFKAHQSDSKLKNQIYSYLEHLTPYSKQQLSNEVKEYVIKKNEIEVRTLERILQKEINQIMPGIRQKYEQEMKRVEEQRMAHQGTDRPEQSIRNPRRKFVWSESLR